MSVHDALPRYNNSGLLQIPLSGYEARTLHKESSCLFRRAAGVAISRPPRKSMGADAAHASNDFGRHSLSPQPLTLILCPALHRLANLHRHVMTSHPTHPTNNVPVSSFKCHHRSISFCVRKGVESTSTYIFCFSCFDVFVQFLHVPEHIF